MTVEPLAKEFRSAIVITGMLADAKGSDTNNEYIQFMALEEIDFAQTPYCVIACRNNKVNAKATTGREAESPAPCTQSGTRSRRTEVQTECAGRKKLH